MMQTLRGFFKKEVFSLLRDPVLFVAIMIMPLVEMIILAAAITMQANNLRLVVASAPNDTVMERIYDRALGSGWFVPADVPANMAPMDAVQSGRADVALIAPDGGLTRALVRGDGEIQILVDSINILKAQNIEAYLQGVVMRALTDITHAAPTPPIRFDVRVLFNPELNTKFFMVPSLVAILIFISLMMMITIAITKEKEMGTMETLIAAPISKYDIILGKVVPYVVLSLVIMIALMLIGVWMFGVPFVGSGLMLGLAFLAFCVPGCAIAVWLSTYTKPQQQAMLGIVIVAFLALMLSGAIIPTENMPRALQVISHVNPLSHYSYLVRSIILKGPDWSYFARHAAAMLAAGAVIWVWAIGRFKTTL